MLAQRHLLHRLSSRTHGRRPLRRGRRPLSSHLPLAIDVDRRLISTSAHRLPALGRHPPPISRRPHSLGRRQIPLNRRHRLLNTDTQRHSSPSQPQRQPDRKGTRSTYFKWLALVGLGAVLLHKTYHILTDVVPPNLVIVAPLHGDLEEKNGMRLTRLLFLLKEFAEPNLSSIKAICLHVDCHGGITKLAQHCASIIEEIVDLSNDVPVYIFVGEDATSGGYYMVVNADRVFASPNSEIGSIHAVSRVADMARYLAFLGANDEVDREETEDEHKLFQWLCTLPEVREPLTKLRDISRRNREELTKDVVQEAVNAVKAARRRDLSAVLQQFIADVKRGRGSALNLDDFPEDLLFGGHFFTAEDAVKLGLIDDIGDLSGFFQSELSETDLVFIFDVEVDDSSATEANPSKLKIHLQRWTGEPYTSYCELGWTRDMEKQIEKSSHVRPLRASGIPGLDIDYRIIWPWGSVEQVE